MLTVSTCQLCFHLDCEHFIYGQKVGHIVIKTVENDYNDNRKNTNKRFKQKLIHK
jgi:hypothetical protein